MAEIGDSPKKVEIVPIHTPAEAPAPQPKVPEPATR